MLNRPFTSERNRLITMPLAFGGAAAGIVDGHRSRVDDLLLRLAPTALEKVRALLNARGNRAAAEPLYRRALGASERALGPDHPNTVNCLSNLASVLFAKGGLGGCGTALALRARGVRTRFGSRTS